MKIKTSDLIGIQLDWAVAIAEGYRDANNPEEHLDPEENLCVYNWTFMREPGVACVWLVEMRYATNWSQGGPIIEREKISVLYDDFIGEWKSPGLQCQRILPLQFGPTPLIAAMRCYVASKLGKEVEVPDALL